MSGPVKAVQVPEDRRSATPDELDRGSVRERGSDGRVVDAVLERGPGAGLGADDREDQG